MTATVTCDGPECDTAMPLEGLIGWIEVDWIGIRVPTYAEVPGPFHFCSWNCVNAFTIVRMAAAANPVQPGITINAADAGTYQILPWPQADQIQVTEE